MSNGKRSIRFNPHQVRCQGPALVTSTRSQINSKGELLLYGVIGDWWDGLDALSVVNELEAVSGDGGDLVVRIHSDGGRVTEGLAIYNALRATGRRVVVHIDGIAASMASAVACAGDVVYMPANSLMMLHRAHLQAAGNADELRDVADQVEVLENSVLEMYSRKSGAPVEEIRELLADGKNHWYTAQQALVFGLADEITEDIAIAATFKRDQFFNPPTGLWSGLVDHSTAAAAANNSTGSNTMDQFLILAATGGATYAGMILAALKAKYKTVEAAVADLAAVSCFIGEGAVDPTAILTGKAEAADWVLDALGQSLGVEVPRSGDLAQSAQGSVQGAGAAAQGASVEAGEVTMEAVRQELTAERKRNAAIYGLCARYDIPADQATSWIDSGLSVVEARSAALDLIEARSNTIQPAMGVRFTGGNVAMMRTAMVAALMHRMTPGEQLDEAAHQFAHMPLLEMARRHLDLCGVSTAGMTANAIATMAFQTTSDFPNILADIAGNSLRRGYESAPRTFTRFCRPTTAANFKPIQRSQLDMGGGTLPKVGESGEVKRGAMKDSGEAYALATYAEIIPMTRQVIINDDLDAMTRVPTLQGRQAANTESQLVWDLILANGNMSDGNALFSAGHGNLGTGVIGEAGLNSARKAMRVQTGLDKEQPLNLSPSFLIVPAALETKAQQYVTLITPNTAASVNPFQGTLEVVTEPRLDSDSLTKWYASADPNAVDTIEYCYLEGEQGVYLETRNGFDVEGVELKARLDFAAGVIDWRGLYRSSGA